MSALVLIRQAEVFGPEAMGCRDVLIAGGTIAEVAPHIDIAGSPVEIVEASGRRLLPGLVDALTHPCGGGGEGGFGNRTTEIEADALIRAGITSPVGALGTDWVARSLEVLYGKTMALRAHGLAAFMYTGAYRVPVVTLTGEVTRDVVLVDPVIGVGEVAISDHRSSAPTPAELARVAADARVGGIVTGKGGTVLVHVGDGAGGLAPLRDALAQSDLPITAFYPTHCNRNRTLLADAIAWARDGGFIDFTVSTTPDFIAAGEVPAVDALREALEAGVPADRVTLSSDAGGSLPLYVDGELAGLEAAPPHTLLEALQTAAGDPASWPAVVSALTSNPATALGLTNKGAVRAGGDADLLLLDDESLDSPT